MANSLPSDIMEFPPALSKALFQGDLAAVRGMLPGMMETPSPKGDTQDEGDQPRPIDVFAYCVVAMNQGSPHSPPSDFQGQALSFALELGADPNYIHDYRSLLGEAAAKPGTALLEILLDHGACINDTGPSVSGLATAIQQNDRATIEFLLDRGANPNAVDHQGDPVVFHALRGQRQRLLPLLQKAGADFSAVNKDGETIIHAWLASATALNKGMIARDERTLAKLVASGLDPAQPDANGLTPRQTALRRRNNKEALALAKMEAEFAARNLDTCYQPKRRRAGPRL